MLKKIILIASILMGSASAASLNGGVDNISVDLLISQLMLDDTITPIDTPLILELNSGGGSVLAGFRLINKMRSIQQSGRKINAIVTGVCASMCFTILQAADKRYSYPLGLLMQHGVSGGGRRAMEALERQMRLLESRKIGMSTEVWTRMSEGETWFTPEESLRLNIIDGIVVKRHIKLPMEPEVESEKPATN